MQAIIHYILHLLFPLFLAYAFFTKEWRKAYIIFLMAMLVDVDHLFANPVFNPCRCSIGYHWLHSYPAIAVYIALLFFRKTRLIGIALCWHMITDGIDCGLQQFYCK